MTFFEEEEVPKSYAQKRAEEERKQEKLDKAGEVAVMLLIAPALLTVMWNYGVTEALQSLGGPDANVSLLAGMLAVLFIRGLWSLLSR